MTATTADTRFTVEDYKSLPEGFPAQLIEGDLVKEPSPTRKQQGIVFAFASRLAAVAGERRVLVAPADLVLDRWNVLQPDVLGFDCDFAEAEERGRMPMLVAEVLSPGTEERVRSVKCSASLRAGIREVWLIDPRAGVIEVRTRDGSVRYGVADEATSGAVPGFRVSLRALTGARRSRRR